ncbi:MAG TPA: class I SAM-dependent methyltransferase [Candidatus Nitrosopolaris sp.]|nr:class I SAM-dependent methyltransferase [Candidatus Nitrosopolaris sp.]
MSLETIVDFFVAYQRTAAIKAAIELDLFTAIGEGRKATVDLAERCQAAERGIRILCDYLTVVGLLVKDGDRYALGSDAAAFLDRRSPAYAGSLVTAIAGETNLRAFERLTAAVRRGGTALAEGGTLAPEHPVWVEFARAMIPGGILLGRLLAGLLDVAAGGRMRVLDIAAGHGLYGIAVAKANPAAEIVALDWPNVLAVAQGHAEEAGVAERYRTLPGSALTVEFGAGYHLVLLVHFHQDLDRDTCERLLAKVHAALMPGGRAVALGFIPNDDRISPPAHAAFGLAMLATTPGGDAYTVTELDGMFRHAGFARTELCELTPTSERVMIAYRAQT